MTFSLTQSTRRTAAALASIAGLSLGLAAYAAEDHDATHAGREHAESGDLHLSSDLKAVLNQEMAKIQEGMVKMIPAIASGDWATIHDTAARIRDSYILKQSLTAAQREELREAVSADFLRRDQAFHNTSDKLAHAAHGRDAELVNFYYYRLHDQCVTCHVAYAKKRFPGLAGESASGSDHH